MSNHDAAATVKGQNLLPRQTIGERGVTTPHCPGPTLLIHEMIIGPIQNVTTKLVSGVSELVIVFPKTPASL